MKCKVNEEGEHIGWELPNKDIICLDCGELL